MSRHKVNGLTIKQARILLDIVEYSLRHNGEFPTLREIMRISDISSTSTVAYYLDRLVGEGYVLKHEHLCATMRYSIRGIAVVPPAWYYGLKAKFTDKKRAVLDIDWGASLEEKT